MVGSVPCWTLVGADFGHAARFGIGQAQQAQARRDS